MWCHSGICILCSSTHSVFSWFHDNTCIWKCLLLLWIYVHVAGLSHRCLKLRLGSEVGCVWCSGLICIQLYIYHGSRTQPFSTTRNIPDFLTMPRCCTIICICEGVILPHLHKARSGSLTPINAHCRVELGARRSYSKLSLWRHSYRQTKVADVTVYLLSTLAAAQSTRVG